jgi:hypothetical protein
MQELKNSFYVRTTDHKYKSFKSTKIWGVNTTYLHIVTYLF